MLTLRSFQVKDDSGQISCKNTGSVNPSEVVIQMSFKNTCGIISAGNYS